ncbi:pyridoxal phosphate-dependent decarboxylase family protein [Aspergillus saccharolyticus JOP 1030-1]|uniref:PLP-dependent transferase n=1 Tax=Aspergillus saccharolyticus JOP 1030-1 TaxID=1450539 RepID=A0A318ZB57_9EURO|nr:PLP-dependent transferase [Aspergillus saccharolyticus JOP 1030-1]PYH44671.1 PLP-dependent transferase [Aspergillus saccharolyticus JOP 1030-1]
MNGDTSEEKPVPDIMQDLDGEINLHWRRIVQLLAELIKVSSPNLNDQIITHATSEDITQLRHWGSPGTPQPLEKAIEEARTIFDYRIRTNHPLFFGYVPSGTVQLSWLGDILISAFNAHTGGRKAGLGACVIEEEMIKWLTTKINMPKSAGGIFVSGGSVANMMSIAVARDQKLDRGEYDRGVIYISQRGHFCVSKMSRVLGFERSQIHEVRCNDAFYLDIHDLKGQLVADRKKGLVPFMIVATCGYTETGAIDPIGLLAEIAHQEALWLHVDGSYGASVALSHSHSHLAADLGLADSVAWDAHKWLFSSYGCGMVLVRDKDHLASTFGVESRLSVCHAGESSRQLQPWDLGVELTRPARAISLWFTLRVLGEERIGRMIDYGMHVAEEVQAQLQAREGWDILTNVKLGVVIFRNNPKTSPERDLDAINAEISETLLKNNHAGIFPVDVSGVKYLRMCCITTRLHEEDIERLVEEIDKTAKEVGRKLT